MLPVAVAPAGALAQWQADFGASLVYDSNLPQAQLASDIVDDFGVAARAGIARSFSVGDHADLSTGIEAKVLRYATYEGASVISLGASAGYRRKLGLGLTAPRVGVDASLAWEDSPEPVRDGYRFLASAFFSKRFDERLEASVTLAYDRREQRDATSVVPGIPGDPFSLQSRSVTLRGSYAFGERATFIASAGARGGDVVSSTRRNPEIFVESAAIAPDPAFGPDYIAYRLTGARTLSLGAGVAYELSRRSSLEAFLTTHDTRARGGLDYDVQRFSVSYAYHP
jgi:hypothetical protein